MIHCDWNKLPYLQFHADAERRHKRGERQVWCRKCRIWVWPDQVALEHKGETLTIGQFNWLVRRTKERDE